MRLYNIEEYANPRTTSGVDLEPEILEPGTIICMQLSSRERFPATHAHYDAQSSVKIETLNIDGDIPSFCRVEQVFFKVLEYLTPPRDRYVVECINWVFNGGVFPIKQDRKERTLKVALTPDIRNHLLDGVDFKVWTHKRKLNTVKTKKMAKLEAGLITIEEYNEICNEAMQKYEAAKIEQAEESAKYTIGEMTGVKMSFSLDCEDFKGQFINSGDRITAKRKNVQLVYRPEILQPLIVKSSPTYVTNWNGRILNAKVRDIITVGNIVRVLTEECGCVYMHITRDMGAQFEGIMMPTYLINGEDRWIGYYYIFPRTAISEVPQGWGIVNTKMESLIKKYYSDLGLGMTGMTTL